MHRRRAQVSSAMDIAQIFGDYVQLLGMAILLAKICLTRNCAGISGKTQLLNVMVFTTRYADLTIRYVSLYNTILKIIYLAISYCTVLSMFYFRKTYDRKHDAFRIELLILPCAVFALFLNNGFETLEVFWTFSAYLEAVSIVPQVYLASKSKVVESIVVSYVSCLGLYRGCYLMHWTYAYLRHGRLERIAIAGGLVQLIFYCDFFARNLPILKPKASPANFVCPPEKEADDGKLLRVTADDPRPEATELMVADKDEHRDGQRVCLPVVEKVTLLTPQEPEVSN